MTTATGSIGYITSCQVCGEADLQMVLSLGHHALVSSYLTSATVHEAEETYPLDFCRCTSCGLLQLSYIVDPKKAFHPTYPYHSGMTNMLIRNFRSLAETVIAEFGLQRGNLVVDIGSNDGTLLKPFKERGLEVLGVEPTNAAQVALQSGIPTIQAFFSEQVGREVAASHGKAKLVTMTNAFAHVNDVHGLLRGVRALLDTNGVFVSESQYLLDTLDKSQFDCIYHEHLRYYALRPLDRLFNSAGLHLFDAEHVAAAGGSIRAYASLDERQPSKRLLELRDVEERAGLYDDNTFAEFARRAVSAKHDLLALLLQCKRDGARIAAIGSPARSNSLLNFTKIDTTIVDYACERTGSPKIGLYTPGVHLPVVDEDKLLSDQPEFALMLSWHIGDELMQTLRGKGYRGKFIVPLPTAVIAAT